MVTNTGTWPGSEVVQLYIRDLVGSTTRPVKELKGFQKIFLEPGQSEIVRFKDCTGNAEILQLRPATSSRTG